MLNFKQRFVNVQISEGDSSGGTLIPSQPNIVAIQYHHPQTVKPRQRRLTRTGDDQDEY